MESMRRNKAACRSKDQPPADSKETGTSVLQPQRTEFYQQPEGVWMWIPPQSLQTRAQS